MTSRGSRRPRFPTRALAWAGTVWLAVAGCSSTLVDYEARVHVVQPGETLYTIAWQHGLDYQTLARWNELGNPDLIYVGQRLRLTAPAPASARRATPARTTSPPPRPAPPLPEPKIVPPPDWQWPTQGPVLSRFGDRTAIPSGIGIGGRAGQAVGAAAAGRVVYVGSGLIGYGQLVIIKHNETYLSAYGHLGRVLVRQAQQVERGEKIAEMGLGPQREPRLHFEIRRNGVPIDPLQFLRPARGSE